MLKVGYEDIQNSLAPPEVLLEGLSVFGGGGGGVAMNILTACHC